MTRLVLAGIAGLMMSSDELRGQPQSASHAAWLNEQDALAIPVRLPDDAPGEASVWIRYVHQGGKLNRDGKSFRLQLRESALEEGSINGSTILDALTGEGVDLLRWRAMVLDTQVCSQRSKEEHPDTGRGTAEVGGAGEEVKRWVEVTPTASFPLSQEGPRHLDIKMCAGQEGEQQVLPHRHGFFTIGVAGGEIIENLGTLWRSAYQFDAKGLFVIGHRYKLRQMEKTDVVKVTHKIPLIQYPDWSAFTEAAPHDAKWVAVEKGGEPLETFQHPPCAVYVLGTDEDGLPAQLVGACHSHVSLPSIDGGRVSVPTAGSLVMYDRVLKQVWERGRREEGGNSARGKRGH